MKQKIPLVLLAGLMCDESVWQPVAEQLNDIADVSAFGFAGFDRLPAMAEYVLSKAPETFALAGHSMGGRVALEVYRQAPKRVTHLGLLNTGVHPVREAEIPSRLKLVEMAEKLGMESIADNWLPPMLSTKARGNPILVNELRAMIMKNSVADFRGQVQALLNRPNAEDVLPSIVVPTLLLSGTEDLWSPMSQHHEMQKSIPADNSIQSVELEGVGHMSIVEAPEPMTKALRDLLTV